MNDEDKTKEQLISELAELRQRLSAVTTAPPAGHRPPASSFQRSEERFRHIQSAFQKSEERFRQLETAFQKREERFRSLIEHSYGAVVLIDAAGTFTYVGPSIHRVLGYQPEELLGTYGFDLVHPDDLDAALLKFAGILQGPKNRTEMEVRVWHKDAGWQWFEVTGTNLLDEPAVQGAVINFRDIAERKQVEADLRASAERFRQAQEAGRVGIWGWDILTGRIVWDGLEAIHGLEPGAFHGPFEAYLEYVHPEDRDTISASVTQTLEQGAELLDLEYRIIWPDGSVHWIEGRGQVYPDQEGRMARMVGTCYDITLRKTAAQQIDTALAQLEAVLENVDAGLMLMGGDNETILWANQHFRDFFGVPDIESIRGNPMLTRALRQQVAANATFDSSIEDLRALIRQDPNYRGPAGQIEVIRPALRFLRRFTTPVRSEQGANFGRLWLYYDITEQRRLEDQMIRYQKVDSIGRLAAGMAHEFNNLLGAIMGFNSLALQKAPPLSDVGSYLQEVDKAVSRASDLISQILVFSRSQSFEPKALDLNEIIFDADRMLRHLVGADVELVTVLASDLRLVKADPGQLNQVLVNLMVNARDAMPQGGKLIISTSNANLSKEQAARRWVTSAERYVVLTVTDTGIGMTEQVKAHLFEPFFTTKEMGKGTGLGLSTCYGIVRQAEGQIEVFSEPGQGATFKIYLPATETGAEAGVAAIEPDDQFQLNDMPRGRETVLFAEDDPFIRKFVCEMLQAQGYTVLEASNGVDALSLVNKYAGEGIHLLMTDLVMPGMGGKELAEQVREIYPESRVLFISGYTESFLAGDSFLDAGADFLAKPFMPDALAAKIRELLDRAKV